MSAVRISERGIESGGKPIGYLNPYADMFPTE